ncbi:bZIP transcription factor 2 [Bienertia sinuspersici]
MLCSQVPVHFDDLNDFLSYFQENPLSGSEESNQQGDSQNVSSSLHYFDENHERKIRRMISNRLSARRSRLRKKKHLENMTIEVNQLKALNRELKSRLSLYTYHGHIVRRENERLSCEFILLKQRLSDLYHTLLGIQPSNNGQQ